MATTESKQQVTSPIAAAALNNNTSHNVVAALNDNDAFRLRDGADVTEAANHTHSGKSMHTN
jgi:hypothetical protein